MSIIIQTNKATIKNFTIFAERHYGTNFFEEWMNRCFGVNATWKFGWKHFWTYHNNMISDSQNTLFIGIVRHPYNWLSATYRKPYHIVQDADINFLKFLQQKIISQGADGSILEEKFDNIFSLRETKNQHLLNIMPKICDNYLLINYESFFSIDMIFDEIASSFELPKYKFLSNNFIQSNCVLSPLELDTINKNLKWTTENLLNYHML